GPADGGTLGVGRAVDPRAVAVFLQVTHAGRETAGGAGRGDVIGRAVVGDAVADLVDVADTGGGPADGRALGIVRARGARPGAGLRHVADAGRRATDGAAGNEAVGGTGVADPVAALRHVAEAGRGPADRRALGVVRARGARPGAGLRDVADASGCPAHGAGGGEVVGGAGVGDAVAALRHVAEAGRRSAHGGALRVRGTARARPGTLLRDVADAGCAATRDAGGDEAVGGTGVADAVAALRHVADAGRGPADRHALGVVRACRARPAAGLRDVAGAGGGAADGAGRLDGAGRGATVAVCQVAVVARLCGLDDAVAAGGGPEGRDGRRPSCEDGRAVGEIAAGRGHDAVFGVDRDV